jgi:hypothetical protein
LQFRKRAVKKRQHQDPETLPVKNPKKGKRTLIYGKAFVVDNKLNICFLKVLMPKRLRAWKPPLRLPVI